MIYFHTALYYEAAAVIVRYKMKKISDIHVFQVFQDRNKSITLVVGGTGSVNGAVSASFLLTAFPPSAGDIFVNLGLCAARAGTYAQGDVVLINQIDDGITDRRLYPEMLYRHPFAEGSLYSAAQIVSMDHRNVTDNIEIPADTADMEGAFVFQAASKFITLDRIFIIKIVSDFFKPQSVTKEMAKALAEKNIDAIGDWLESVSCLTEPVRFQYSAQEAKLLADVASRLKLTVTMQARLNKQCKYRKLTGGRISEILEKFTSITYADKMEGKQVYGRLIDELSGTD